MVTITLVVEIAMGFMSGEDDFEIKTQNPDALQENPHSPFEKSGVGSTSIDPIKFPTLKIEEPILTVSINDADDICCRTAESWKTREG